MKKKQVIKRLRNVIYELYRERAEWIKSRATKILVDYGASEDEVMQHRLAIDETWEQEAKRVVQG